MKKRVFQQLSIILCLTAVIGFCCPHVPADTSAIHIIPVESPVTFHSDLQQEVLDAGYKNITDYYLPNNEKQERSYPAGITLSWDYDAENVPDVFLLTISENEDMSDGFEIEVPAEAEGGTYHFAVQNLFLGNTYYYTVSDGKEESSKESFTVDSMPPRNIYAEGVTNMRDIGGWITEDGYQIRQGLLYRCGQLNLPESTDLCITEDGIRTMLDTLHIRSEVDLRKTEDNESGGLTMSPLGETVQYFPLPIVYNVYDPSADSIREFFRLLTDENNYPLIYHCKIGTDRTGFITYLLYGILNVPMDEIYTDYVFSNLGLIDGNRNAKRLDKSLKENFGKKMSDSAAENSISYLHNIGITDDEISRIRDILLEKPEISAEITDPLMFDFHTEKQQAYLDDPDPANIFEYANGLKDYSQPEPLICDFSGDAGIEESETYIFQKASEQDFSDAVTITGLSKKTYDLYNLKLGEHFYWRGGTSLEDVEMSPVHEVIVTDRPPRVLRIEGVTNVRDIGGYDSGLTDGGKIRQGLYYRGAKLNGIKRKGLPRITGELGVKVEVDLRDADQCNGPYVDGTQYYAIPISRGNEVTRFEEFAEEYRQIYEVISHAQEGPVYLHCLAGADRTGIVTFMLLAVCGVSRDDITRDYLFTNFSDQGKRDMEEINSWWEKLEAFEGDTIADKAAGWMMSKGVPKEQIETIRTIFVEGYTGAGE